MDGQCGLAMPFVINEDGGDNGASEENKNEGEQSLRDERKDARRVRVQVRAIVRTSAINSGSHACASMYSHISFICRMKVQERHI